jgi:hypothetical protein
MWVAMRAHAHTTLLSLQISMMKISSLLAFPSALFLAACDFAAFGISG